MDRRIQFQKLETSVSLLTPESPRFVIETAIGQDQFMNHEWHCTGKAIDQIMIVFLQSTTSSRRKFSFSSK